VHSSWQTYFDNLQIEPLIHAPGASPPTVTDRMTPGPEVTKQEAPSEPQSSSTLADYAKVQLLVRAYQARGHEKARIDPLEIRGLFDGSTTASANELTTEYYGFTAADLDRHFQLGPGVLPRFAGNHSSLKLREIVDICERTYCGSYAVEYLHIADRERCDWIRDRLEIPNPINYSTSEKAQILDRLTWSATFEKFLATKYPNKKRYGLDGGESLTPGIKALVDHSVDKHGIKNIVIGSQHRGRLSIMSNLIRRPNKVMFYEFSHRVRATHATQSGVVIYTTCMLAS